MPSDDLPGLESDPTPEEPFEIPDVEPIEPKTYDGLTNAELDAWFEDYGGQERFDKDHGPLLDELRDSGGRLLPIGLDEDLEAVMRAMFEMEGFRLGEAQSVGEELSAESLLQSAGFLDTDWFAANWHRLGPELKARFRRSVDPEVETKTSLGTGFRMLVGTLVIVVFGGFIFWLGSSSDDPADTDVATTTLADEITTTLDDATTTTDPSESPPTTLEEGADPEGDMFGSPGTETEDSPEAAASDITASAYYLDEGVHVFQMKVRGDGQALATSDDVRWYNPRFFIQTPQGDVTIDVDATDGIATVLDAGPFSDPQQISVDIVWLEPGCLQVAATIIGLDEEATSFQTELTVRLADGTDFADDASFGSG